MVNISRSGEARGIDAGAFAAPGSANRYRAPRLNAVSATFHTGGRQHVPEPKSGAGRFDFTVSIPSGKIGNPIRSVLVVSRRRTGGHLFSAVKLQQKYESLWLVNATGISHTDNGVENIAYITMRYDDGMIAHAGVSWVSPVQYDRSF
jgi:hypothetical protein